jgi:hypothetical protein
MMQVKINKVKQNLKQSKGCACENFPRRSLLLPPRQQRQKNFLMLAVVLSFHRPVGNPKRKV